MWLNVVGGVIGLMIIREVLAQLFSRNWLTSNLYTLVGYLLIWGVTVWGVMRRKKVEGEYWVTMGILYMMINLMFVRVMRVLGIMVPVEMIKYIYFPVFYGLSIWGVVTIVNKVARRGVIAGLGIQLLADGLTIWESTIYLPWVGVMGKVLYWVASGILFWALWQDEEVEG